MNKRNPGDRIEEWLSAYLQGESDGEEKAEIERWMRADPAHSEIYRKAVREYWFIRWAQREQNIQTAGAKERLNREMRKSPRLFRRWYAVAASIAVLVALGGIWLFKPMFSENRLQTTESVIKPGHPQARLTLSSGEEIDLSSHSAILRSEHGAFIQSDTVGRISYRTRENSISKQLAYNKIATPRGGEYVITLSDGSRIWLNADSKLQYPVAFAEDKREVAFQGEAYFEITPDVRRPFIVRSGEYRLQVYGTEFNLNTYHRDCIQTVLVKGSIGFKANMKTKEQRLHPNQIGIANESTGTVTVHDTDVYPYIAWKNQELVFVNETLERVLEKAARWYDVEIFYQQEALKELRFFGNIPRYADIRVMLDKLEATSEARFTVKGRTVIVSQ